MASAQPTSSGTSAPAGGAGFPPFQTHTFPGQIFWLTIAFALLLTFVWRVVVPRIGGTIAERKSRIAAELAKAEQDRREADQAWTTYQNTLIEARQHARTLIEENRSQVRARAEQAERSADTEADEAVAKAEARLAEMRAQARAQIRKAAQEAAASIVARLIGETVSPEEAAAAVAAGETIA
jgi:F-type H+-transporting ATPase subunit b